MCIALLIMGSYFHIQVNAEPESKQIISQELGKTHRSAMVGIDLVYKEDWVYFINDSKQLERRHNKTQEREILYDGEMTNINVINGYVYGFVLSDDAEKQGIYKLNLQDKALVRISDKYAVNLIVIDDWIYFKEDYEVGILRMKTDGSQLEEVYKGHASAYTVYGDHIYFTTDGKFARIGINGEGFHRYDDTYEYWSTFIIQDNSIYTIGDIDENSTLLKISLDGKKMEKVIEDFPYYYYDIQFYDGYMYYEDDGNLLRTTLEAYNEETVYGTGLMNQYTISDGQLLFSLETEDLSEVWHVDLSTMSEKRVVPKHYAGYDELKKILSQSDEANKSIKQFGIKVLSEKYYTEDKEKTSIDMNLQVDNINDVVYMQVSLGIFGMDMNMDMDYWFIDEDDLFIILGEEMQKLMQNNEKFMHFYGKDVSHKTAQMRSNDLFGDKDMFALLRGAKLRESSTQYIIQVKNNLNGLSYLFDEDLGLSDSVDLAPNADMYIYINKKSQLVDRIKMKLASEDYIGSYTTTLELTTQYNKSTIKVPRELDNFLKQKEKSMPYIDSANKAFENKQYDSAIKYCKQAIETYSFNKEVYLIQGKVAYAKGEIEETILRLTDYIDKHQNTEYVKADVYDILAECYFSQGDYGNAIDSVYENMKRVDKSSLRMNLIMGISQLETNNGYIASYYLDDVLAVEPLHEEALVGRIGTHVNTNEYKLAVDLADEYEALLKKSRAMWYYKGVSYFKLGEAEKGLEVLKKSLNYPEEKNTNITKNSIYIYISHIYCAIEDYDNAETYIKKMTDDDNLATWKDGLEAQIKYGRLPINKKLSGFVGDNYLYRKSIKNFDDKITAFDNKKNASPEEVKAFYDTIKLEEDPFTWLIQGEEFDRLMDETALEDVIYKQLDDKTEYIQINSFLPNTGNKAVEAIRNIVSSYDKDLILDLRGNGGGAIQAAATILDALLGECTSVYLIDRDGEIFEASSDEYYRSFRRIFVLMDEHSASSSEIVALSLKKFGDDVTLVGRKTYGKGVAQNVFIDRNNKTALFLVSSYWNVLQENIDGKGIEPDVAVEGKTLENYLEIIQGIEFVEED